MTTLHDPAYSDAQRAAWLLAVDPAGLGGLCLRGPDSPLREQVLNTARCAWPASAPWRRLPAQIDDDRLLGGLDLGLSLAAGRPISQAGLLAEADLGVLLIGMAERLPRALAGKLSAALDRGQVDSPVAGAAPAQARCAVIALDESCEPDEALPAALLERLALVVSLSVPLSVPLESPPQAQRLTQAVVAAVWPPATTRGLAPPGDLVAAQRRLAALPFDAGCIEAFCAAAQALGLHSLRPPLQAWRAACAAAALAGHDRVEMADAELAARLVIAPRARQLPAPTGAPLPELASTSASAPAPAPQDETPGKPPPDAAPAEPPPTSDPALRDSQDQHELHRPLPGGQLPTEPPTTPPPTPKAKPRPSDTAPAMPDDLDERVLAAARAAIPADLLASLASLASLAVPAGLAAGPQPRAAGRGQASGAASHRGRPLTSRRGELRGAARLDVLQTLRAAVPWQRLRREAAASPQVLPASSSQAAAPRLLIRRQDFHIRRCKQAQETTIIFAVDASGSQALHRLAEAKGAVELLLADCYVRRDRVALVSFRGTGAEVLLAPTRSLVRARRSLAALPGGGGTPLAAGIATADQLAQAVQRRDGGVALVVLLTDARANVALDGSGGRPQALQDALQAARSLRLHGTASLLIDTSARPEAAALQIAQALAARYVALPKATAVGLHEAVQSTLR